MASQAAAGIKSNEDRFVVRTGLATMQITDFDADFLINLWDIQILKQTALLL